MFTRESARTSVIKETFLLHNYSIVIKKAGKAENKPDVPGSIQLNHQALRHSNLRRIGLRHFLKCICFNFLRLHLVRYKWNLQRLKSVGEIADTVVTGFNQHLVNVDAIQFIMVEG